MLPEPIVPAEEHEPLTFDCPHCGEPNAVAVDSISSGEYAIQDCWVCCRPIGIVLAEDAQGRLELQRIEPA